MSLSLRRFGVSAALLVLGLGTASAAELHRYREFQLGTSVATVTAVTKTTPTDMKVMHQRPALLQQLEWRPRYMSGAPTADRDSISQVSFSFVDDKLFRIGVSYERTKTAGLTDADMIASLTAVYGPQSPLLPRAKARPGYDQTDAASIVAEWRSDDSQVQLQRTGYNDSFALVITSISLDTLARQAQVSAIALDAQEAPQREAALAKKRDLDTRAAEERARTANKEAFKP